MVEFSTSYTQDGTTYELTLDETSPQVQNPPGWDQLKSVASEFVPLHNQVVIYELPAVTRIGGIYVDHAKAHKHTHVGVVLAVGPDVLNLRPKDVVVWRHASGDSYHGMKTRVRVQFMPEEDVIAIVPGLTNQTNQESEPRQLKKKI